jgi:threonine dehydrogenase-like Zn-dependent dehydrogenase
MRGVYCNGQTIELRRDLPMPLGDENRRFQVLRVKFAGICDTDLQLAQGYMGYRGILGHEFVGLSDSGQRVTAEINNACGVCPTCSAGLRNHCPHRTVLGILGLNGAMADHVAVQRDNIHEIPDEIDDLEAVFIEPLAAAFRVPEQVPLGAQTKLGVLGDGKLGILCAWVARDLGAPITLIGKHPAKLSLAGREIETRLVDQTQDLKRRFDVVIDVTGSPSGFATALSLVRPCGTVVLKTTIARDHNLALAPIVIDEIRVIGSRCGPFARAIRALAERRIDVQPLIEAVYALDDAQTAFTAAARKGARKIILRV